MQKLFSDITGFGIGSGGFIQEEAGFATPNVSVPNYLSTLPKSFSEYKFTRWHDQHMPWALSKNTDVNPSIWDRTSKTKYSIRLFFTWSIAVATLTTFAADSIGAG
jgi:hypothetical protein